jgi:hypothetical protein
LPNRFTPSDWENKKKAKFDEEIHMDEEDEEEDGEEETHMDEDEEVEDGENEADEDEEEEEEVVPARRTKLLPRRSRK